MHSDRTRHFLLTLLLAAAAAGGLLTRPALAQAPVPDRGAAAAPEMTTLNFVDMDAFSVFEVLEEMTGRIILRQQTLPPVKINFNSRGPITKEDAILALESLLSLNGIMLTEMGDTFVKAVPATNPNAQVPELLVGTSLDLPPSQRIFAKLFKLDYLNSSQDAVRIIQPLLSQNSILDIPKSNTLLIADALVNLQRVERILQDADRPSELRGEVRFIKLGSVSAEDMSQRLESLINGALRQYLEGNTFIEADSRTNKLIIFSHPKNIEILTAVIDELDVESAPLTRSEIFELRHADAEELEALINTIVQEQQQAQEQLAREARSSGPVNQANQQQAEAGPQQPQPGLPQPAAPTPAAPAAGGGLASGGEGPRSLQFSDFVGISSDTRTNSIVAFGTDSDLRTIGDLIDKLDRPLPQVRIEAIITQVSLREDQARGVDSFNINYDGVGGFGGGVVGGAGAGEFTFLPDGTMDLVIGTAESDSAVRILQSPVVLVSHNQEATINVSESRPIITGTQTSGDVTSTVRSSVEYRDIGIQLTVTPLIGFEGTVQMEISQVIESVNGFVTIDGNEQPIILTREAESYVSVNNGEIIVLGGLQENEQNLSRGRLFGLAQVPVLGNLFGSSDKTFRRTEFVIFIQPRILTNPAAAAEDARKEIDQALERDALKAYIEDGTPNNTYVETSRIPELIEQRELQQEVGRRQEAYALEQRQREARRAFEAEQRAEERRIEEALEAVRREQEKRQREFEKQLREETKAADQAARQTEREAEAGVRQPEPGMAEDAGGQPAFIGPMPEPAVE